MCKNCEIIDTAFMGAQASPHANYSVVYAMLMEMLKKKRIAVYAGDCEFEKAQEVLYSETHYTVYFYLRCTECDRLFFFGACTRGTPTYKEVSKDIVIDNLWGTEGEYFQNK